MILSKIIPYCIAFKRVKTGVLLCLSAISMKAGDSYATSDII